MTATNVSKNGNGTLKKLVESFVVSVAIGLLSGLISAGVAVKVIEVRLDYIEKAVDKNTSLIEQHMMNGG